MECEVRRGKTYNQLNGLCCGFIIPLSCENRPLAGESCMEFRGLCLTGWLQFQLSATVANLLVLQNIAVVFIVSDP